MLYTKLNKKAFKKRCIYINTRGRGKEEGSDLKILHCQMCIPGYIPRIISQRRPTTRRVNIFFLLLLSDCISIFIFQKEKKKEVNVLC
jgi:hypothetical protein